MTNRPRLGDLRPRPIDTDAPAHRAELRRRWRARLDQLDAAGVDPIGGDQNAHGAR